MLKIFTPKRMKKININYFVAPKPKWNDIPNKVFGEYFVGEIGKALGFPNAEVSEAGTKLTDNGEIILEGYPSVALNWCYTITALNRKISKCSLENVIDSVLIPIIHEDPPVEIVNKSKNYKKSLSHTTSS